MLKSMDLIPGRALPETLYYVFVVSPINTYTYH